MGHSTTPLEEGDYMETLLGGNLSQTSEIFAEIG
jgi:hypothetical protein